MEALELQQQFFNYLKNSLPSHVSLADELAELLQIGYDSVYRRIRGEKHLTLSELKIICSHYKLSLDHALQIQSDAIVFNTREVVEEIRNLESYLKQVLDQVHYFQSFKDRKLYYLCKDFTLFHFFFIPGLAAFKSFFWMRDILGDERLKNLKFSVHQFPFPDIIALEQQIAKAYNKIDSIELMNLEIIASTIGQIEFYREAGIFASEEDMIKTCDSLEEMVNHVQAMAERGIKYFPGESELVANGSIELYLNEVIIGNNTIMAKLDGKLITFIPHAIMKYMNTRDSRFGDYTLKYFINLMNRSTLISTSGSKERSKFFNRLRQKVRNLKLNHSTVD
jgi:hypothetical protein